MRETEPGAAFAHRRLVSLIDFGRRWLLRFVELEGFDRSMALAGQMFAALLPLLIVIGAFAPGSGRDLADAMIDRFELTGSAAAAVREAVAQPAAVTSSVNVLGVVLLVISALSFVRALQRLYVRAWRLPKLGLYANAWGLEWLLAFAAYWLLQPVIVAAFSGVVAFAVSLTLATVQWLFTPWLLVGRRIAWRRLLPQAVATALSVAVFSVAAGIYLPHAFSVAAEQFGVIGVFFALLSALFAYAMVLVVTAALGAVLAEPAP